MPVPESCRRTRQALLAALLSLVAGSEAGATTLLQYGFGPGQTALKLTPDNAPPTGLSAAAWIGVPDTPFGKSGTLGGGVDAALGFEASSLVDQVRHFDLGVSLDASHRASVNGVALTFCPGACGGGGAPGSTSPGTLVVKVGGTSVGSSPVTVNDTGWRSLNFTGIAQSIGAGQAKVISVEFAPLAGGAVSQQWRIDNLVLDGAVVDSSITPKKVPVPGWALLALGGGLAFAARRCRSGKWGHRTK